jgi:ribosomal protection tetracycline resistance protein
MRTLNLGILAHVDAGKTSLTERLLHAAGVIDRLGHVDDGDTQTDTLALERERGITIRSAVVSFVVDDVTVNLIDTPGHPDFIAEVERVLSVLDGAVLVVSAVEGVQAQTRILFRALQRLAIPTLVFVNKIDRRGARHQDLIAELRERLSVGVVPLGEPRDLGSPAARWLPYPPDAEASVAHRLEVVADHDEGLLADYVHDASSITTDRLDRALARQTAAVVAHPVIFGSAITGSGVEALTAAMTRFLPTMSGDPEAPLSGVVFKVERGRSGERIAYVRLFSGTLRVRDRVAVGDVEAATVTRLAAFDRGGVEASQRCGAGQIAKVWGLGEVRIGDAVGGTGSDDRARTSVHHFAPPMLETVVVPERPEDRGALHAALTAVAEQDPLIGLRHDPTQQELSVTLYGEVQKEVLQATLATDHGVDAVFQPSTLIHVERPRGIGTAVEILGKGGNPFPATVGLRIEPGVPGTGIAFSLDVKAEDVPRYVYGSVELFRIAMEGYVRTTVQQGLAGWEVTDSVVTMTASDYAAPATTAAHLRDLTPLVLMAALRRAGTVVCEPVHRVSLEFPADTLSEILALLTRLGGIPGAPFTDGTVARLDGTIAAARLQQLQRRLPDLTRGEGTLESGFETYEPVHGPAPRRRRSGPDPLDRKVYLREVAGRG